MVSQSYRSVLEAEVLRDYRLPRSASFCSRYLVENGTCAVAADGTERLLAPRKLGKRASSRKLLTKMIEVPLKQADGGNIKDQRRASEDLRRKGSTRLLNAGKESRRKRQAQAPCEVQAKAEECADQRRERKPAKKCTPRNADMKRRASSKRLIKAKASTPSGGARTEGNSLDMEPAREITFVPDRVERKPEKKAVKSVMYGSGRTKPLVPSRRVTFTETESIVCREYHFDDDEYNDFPEVPSYEHLEHDEYYEVMAEMVAELSGAAPRPQPHREFTVCHAEGESAEFNVCFVEGSDSPKTTDSTAVVDSPAVADAPLQKQQDLKGDSSTASDTLPSSQSDESDESYLAEVLTRSPKTQLADGSPPPKGPPPVEAVIPRTVIYQSPDSKKRRRSALSVMKRTLKIISL